MKFSIIIATYNRAIMVTKAIKSVINQTYTNWELIIIDDGSTDNTKQVIGKLIFNEERIKYFYQENKERSAARNNGIRQASGDYICFLDSDDFFYKRHLEEFQKLISKKNFMEGVYFSGVSYTNYSNKKENYNLLFPESVEFILMNIISTSRACISSLILKKNLFNEKIVIGEDMELWSRLLSKHPFFFHNNKTLIQLEHPERSVNLGSGKEHLKTLKYIFKHNLKKINKNIRHQLLSNTYFNISKEHIKNRETYKAIYFIIISLLLNIKNDQTMHKIVLLLSLIGVYSSKVKNEYI